MAFKKIDVRFECEASSSAFQKLDRERLNDIRRKKDYRFSIVMLVQF